MADEAQKIQRRTDIGVLKEGENGGKIDELCFKRGMSQGIYYAWKAKFGVPDIDEAGRLRTCRRGACSVSRYKSSRIQTTKQA